MPSALELIRRVLLVAGEAVILYAGSRLIFEWVLRSAAGPTRFRCLLVGILRLPGNILHECSHALGYLLAGYRVRQIIFFFVDPEGRGVCRPGKPWSPVALPWLATGAAALMPLLAGAMALQFLCKWLNVPGDPGQLVEGNLAAILLALDFRSWQTWLFVYLALSIGAELAPSEIDLRKSIPALLAAAAAGIVLILTVSSLAPDALLRHHFDVYLGWLLSWVSSALDFGLMAVALVGVPAALIAPLFRSRSVVLCALCVSAVCLCR